MRMLLTLCPSKWLSGKKLLTFRYCKLLPSDAMHAAQACLRHFVLVPYHAMHAAQSVHKVLRTASS